MNVRPTAIAIDARYGLRKERRGIGNYVYHLLREFRRLGPEGFRFVLYGDKFADPEVVQEFRDSLFSIRVLPAPNFVFWEQVALPLAALRDGVDLLHCTGNIAPVLFKPCYLVTTIHDVIEFRRKSFGDTQLSLRHRLSRMYRMGFLPRVARLSDLIITISEFSRQDIGEVLRVDSSKLRVIPIAVGCPTGDPGRDTRWLQKLSVSKPYIFALGAVDRRKNTFRLLEAYRRFKEEIDTDIWLVVAGIERPEVFSEFGAEGVRLFGFLPDEAIWALYRNALFFIYPSLYEGFGLPPLEAMACGTPVIVSRIPALIEVVGDAAVFCDPYDTEALASSMLFLSRNPEVRQELARRGIERARMFSWEKTAQETLKVYEEILYSVRGGHPR